MSTLRQTHLHGKLLSNAISSGGTLDAFLSGQITLSYPVPLGIKAAFVVRASKRPMTLCCGRPICTLARTIFPWALLEFENLGSLEERTTIFNPFFCAGARLHRWSRSLVTPYETGLDSAI